MTTTELIAVLSRFPSQREIEIAIDHGAWSIIFPLPLTLGVILRGEETCGSSYYFIENVIVLGDRIVVTLSSTRSIPEKAGRH